MGAFEELQKKLDSIAKAARDILQAKKFDEIRGIPGEAEWMGYNSANKPTVKKNGEILIVKATSSINLPIGSKVYIDETFTIEYKTKKPPKQTKRDARKEAGYDRRPFKRRKKVPIGPKIIKTVKGSTWLVYHEYLKELDLTTEAQIATNPQLFGWSLFMSLLPLAILCGGVIFGMIYFTLMEFKVEPVDPIVINDLPKQENHPNILANENLEPDDYNYFIILQGVVDQLFTSSGLFAFPPVQSDGFWLGKNQALSNYLFFIGQENQSSVESFTAAGGLTFSNKIFVRPWTYNATDKLVGLLIHYGPGKVQACLYRVVGVFPPKKFKINIHAWSVPERTLPELNPTSENYDATLDSLLPMKHKQFVIPDDITEWNSLLGDGSIGEQEQGIPEIIPYEIIPAHDFQSYGDSDNAYDLTKFASYSQNNLYLNYVVKAYAPWTNLDDSLRINYYALTIKATNLPDDGGIETSYSFKPSTFGIPQEFKFDGNIYLEDPKFPLQAGERNVAIRQITYKIQGTSDPTSDIGQINITAVRSDTEKRGLLRGSSPDSIAVSIDQETGKYQYVPGRSLKFEVSGQPEGFLLDENTGEYVFDQNISQYGIYGNGQGTQFDFEYSVEDPSGNVFTSTITIYLLGANSNFISTGSQLTGSTAIAAPPDAAPPPANEWDPGPVLESTDTGEVQSFNKITTTIPLPTEDKTGAAWGFAAARAQVKIKDVAPPIIKLKVGNQYIDNPASFNPDDFIFSVKTDQGRIGTANNFITDFTVKPANYDRLGPDQELSITYTIEGLLNNAPFVGNFENLSVFQKRKICSDFIKFAFAGDWRKNIFNERTENPTNNFFSSVSGESITRDTLNTHELNIDTTELSVTANWIREFTWYSEQTGREDPKYALQFEQPGGTTTTYEDEYLKILGLSWNFSDEELLFYSSEDIGKVEPLDDESILEAINNASEIQIKNKWLFDALPFGMDRNDSSGKKWRLDRDNTMPLKGYIIFGWAD